MNRAIIAAMSLFGGLMHAGAALAHTGQQAHAHPGHGPVDGLLHWLAGVTHWPAGAGVLAGVAAVVAALVWLRHRRLMAGRD